MEIKEQPEAKRKRLWPWLLLLILTLCAIYSYHRAAELANDVMRNMPDAIIELFHDLLQDHANRDGSGLDV